MKVTPFISDIIQDVISKMNNRLEIKSIASDTVITVCDLRWVSLFNNVIVFDGVDYIDVNIEGIDFDLKAIKLKQAVPNIQKVFIPNPFYLAGTRYATNKEWIQASDREVDKLPLIWLSFTPNPTEVEEIDALSANWSTWRGVTLFFCDNYDSLNWITKDQIKEKIVPLRLLSIELTDTIERMGMIDLDSDIQRNHFPIFGTENANGIDKRIIDAELSAVKANFDIRIAKDYYCEC